MGVNVRARKNHICKGCGGIIVRGEQCVRVTRRDLGSLMFHYYCYTKIYGTGNIMSGRNKRRI